jgi:phosphoglycolate phosphatase-like HAD superfamily hydrolase
MFEYLKEHDIFIATGSGFPAVVTTAINDRMGWKRKGLVDMATCGETAGGDRPKPNMINETLVRAGYLPEGTDLSKLVPCLDYEILLKCGDTQEDIHEGMDAGATTVAVLTGTQKKEMLLEAFVSYDMKKSAANSRIL